jgi:4'-phosphopantetheinyl transferase EntD
VDSASLRVIWASLLPAQVVVELGAYSPSAQPAGLSERSATENMQDSRRVEFLSGRLYARKALIALGREPADIPVAIDRGPHWPDGVIGSITHALGADGGWATAAVAQVTTLQSLGIDMEACENLDSRAIDVILRPTERAYLTKIPLAHRFRQASLLWCTKEAAIKAARGITEPSEVEIVLSDSGLEFRATKGSSSREASGKEWSFEGRTMCSDGFAFAAAYR